MTTEGRPVSFDPPAARGNGWALVLDDASRGFGPPGQAG